MNQWYYTFEFSSTFALEIVEVSFFEKEKIQCIASPPGTFK